MQNQFDFLTNFECRLREFELDVPAQRGHRHGHANTVGVLSTLALANRDQPAAPRPIARRCAAVILDHARFKRVQILGENENGFAGTGTAQNQIRRADEKAVAENVAARRHFNDFARTRCQRLFERHRIVCFTIAFRAEICHGNLFRRNAIRLLATPVTGKRKIR